MERRELDRQAGPFIDAAPRRGGADRLQRRFIGGEIALGVLGGRRRFAEHVVGIAVAARLQPPRVGERGFDRLAADELLAEHPHRDVDAGADHRRAGARDEPGQRRRQALFVGRGDELAGDQQPPGRGVDEGRRRMAEMGAPCGAADLVGDQRVARRRVGHAQQRFAQAHQRHALLAGERVFVHQALHQAGDRPFAQRRDELARQRLRFADESPAAIRRRRSAPARLRFRERGRARRSRRGGLRAG